MNTTPNHISQIRYNWHQIAETNHRGQEAGEDYGMYVVGTGHVTEIVEHPCMGNGDKWFYDVFFEDGHMERIFNPNLVVYTPIDLIVK